VVDGTTGGPEAPGAVASSAEPGGEAPRDTEASRSARELLMASLRRDGLVKDAAVLKVMAETPRHLFVPGASLMSAYRDAPHPIGHGQTISQPTIVGMMTQALELTGGESVLEIGTGSGYQAAVLSRLARKVYSIELLEPLGVMARGRLARLGYDNVEVRVGDGYQGWPEHAPFDRIVVTAAPPEMPPALIAQLREGGVLVAPVGEDGGPQRLLRLRKGKAGAITREDLGAVRFVPMVPAAR
jgi:protein-L-isoaspartate(D-aspartate) O-methyltransferase